MRRRMPSEFFKSPVRVGGGGGQVVHRTTRTLMHGGVFFGPGGRGNAFAFFLRERCDLTTDQGRPPLGDAHPAQRTATRVETYRPRSRPGLPKCIGSGPHARTPPHARARRGAESEGRFRRTHAARSRRSPYILPISLHPQAHPTCTPPREATLSSPAHHTASEVEAPPSI